MTFDALRALVPLIVLVIGLLLALEKGDKRVGAPAPQAVTR